MINNKIFMDSNGLSEMTVSDLANEIEKKVIKNEKTNIQKTLTEST